MKKTFLRFFTLILCLVLCGCAQRTPQPLTDNSVSQVELVLAQVVTDETGIQYSQENPPIEDQNAFLNSTDIPKPQDVALEKVSTAKPSDEVRAVWISYLEMQNLLTAKTKAQFEKNIAQVFDTIAEYNLNTVIVQVRPFGDALYKSDYYPWSYIVTGTEGKDPGFDPLEIMIQQAHNRSLKIEAWINPYRVRSAGNKNALDSKSQISQWIAAKSRAVINYNGVISLNPANAKAQELIINGAVEIAKKYDIDAIHIDDYFYPTTDEAFDKTEYSAYVKNGGKLSLADWRRSNVETLIKNMYSAIKKADKDVVFGISPSANIQLNYNQQYLDVKKILAQKGYCDYIAPQIYFGFEHATLPYDTVIKDWNNLVKEPSIELYAGIAAYKVGVVDSWAGGGKNEWRTSTTELRDMVLSAREQSCYGGFVLYRYDSLFKPEQSVKEYINKEYASLKKIL